jgi:hypothetical protein
MTNTQPPRTRPSAPANPAVAELRAIRQELQELKKEVSTFRNGLTDKVAKGVLIGSVAVAVLVFILQFLLSVLVRS